LPLQRPDLKQMRQQQHIIGDQAHLDEGVATNISAEAVHAQSCKKLYT
jgi:hypothetical protein